MRLLGSSVVILSLISTFFVGCSVSKNSEMAKVQSADLADIPCQDVQFGSNATVALERYYTMPDLLGEEKLPDWNFHGYVAVWKISGFGSCNNAFRVCIERKKILLNNPEKRVGFKCAVDDDAR